MGKKTWKNKFPASGFNGLCLELWGFQSVTWLSRAVIAPHVNVNVHRHAFPWRPDRQIYVTPKANTLNQYPSSVETKVRNYRKLGTGWNRAQTFDEKYLIFEIRTRIRFHAGYTFRYVTSLWPVLRMPCSNSTISQHFAEGGLGQQTSKMASFLVQFSLVNASLCLHLHCSAHRDGGLTAGIFLECFKQALITPEDKKPWLQPSNSDF